MPAPHPFKTLFQRWPANCPRKGVVVNLQGESNPFKSYMLSDEMIVLERTAPDAMSARYVMLEYSNIAAVKLIDPTSAPVFNEFGFEGKLSQ